MAAPSSAPATPASPARPTTTKQPVVMTVRPATVPLAPSPAPAPPPKPQGPWWSRLWLLLTILLIVLLPAITIYSAGGFDPTVPAPKRYTDASPGPTAGTVAVSWIALSVPILVAGLALRKRWPVVLGAVVLAFLWAWYAHFARAEHVNIGLLGNVVALTFLGLLVGVIAQVVYNVVGKPR